MKPKLVVTASQPGIVRKICIRVNHAALRVACLCLCVALGYPVTEALADIPVDKVLEDLGFSDGQKQDALNGNIVRWTTSEASERELAVGLLLLVRVQPEDIAEEFRDVAALKVVEQIRGYGRITSDGGLTDLGGLALVPNGKKEAKRYLSAEPGDELNLSAKEIAAFQGLNVDGLGTRERKKTVAQLVRSTLHARYQAYRAKGLSGLAPYERGGGDQRSPGEELLAATKEARILAKYIPSFHEILLKYPAVKPEKLEEWFHWINMEVFNRPIFILSHRMLLEVDGIYVAADRHFYASHDYNSLQQVGGVFPTKDGALLIYLNRVSADRAGGFGASVKHPVARGLMGPYIEDMFERIRARAERK